MSIDSQLNAKLAELQALIDTMSSSISNREVARATLTVGQLFANWSRRDAEDTNGALTAIVDIMSQPSRYHHASNPNPAGLAAWQRSLPSRQAMDALASVQAAIDAAKRQHANVQAATTQVRGSLATDSMTWSLSGARIGADGYWRRHTDDHVVFGHSYNKADNFLLTKHGLKGNNVVQLNTSNESVWRAGIDEIARDVEPQMRMFRALGINLVVCHINPANHMTEQLQINESLGPVRRCKALLALADLYPEDQLRVVVQISNNLPAWAYAKYAGLKADFEHEFKGREEAVLSQFSQHDVAYDIDHPKALPLMSAFLQSAARHFGCSPALLMWILGNEVNFYTTASPHAALRFSSWLRTKYRRVESLQLAWEAWSVRNFDEAGERLNPAEPAAELSIEQMDGAQMRQWLDWSRFNVFRVSRWARGLCAALRSVSSCHLCSIKFNTAPAFPGSRITNGIDRAAMVRDMDVSGLDMGFSAPAAQSESGINRGVRFAELLPYYDSRRYSSDWLHVSFVLTFLRSIAPSKLAFNQEWHLYTDCCTTVRKHQTDGGLTRIRAWFAALHGQGAHLLWYWGRGHDGTPTAQLRMDANSAGQFLESVLVQPIVMDAFHRAWAELQAHANALAALATAERAVWLLYSTSSYLASSTHARALFNAVEALTFLGVPFGFLAVEAGERPLSAQLSALSPAHWVLAPGCTHMHARDVDALAAWQAERAAGDSGTGRLLALGRTPNEPFAFDAHTAQRVRGDSPAARLRLSTPFVELRRPEALLRELEDQLRPSIKELRPLLCEEAGDEAPTARAAFGVVCRAALVPTALARPLIASREPPGGASAPSSVGAAVYLVALNVRAGSAQLRLRLNPQLRASAAPYNMCWEVLEGTEHALLGLDSEAVFTLPRYGVLMLRCGAPELGNNTRAPSPPSPLISPLVPPRSSTPAIPLTVPSELGNKRTPSPPSPLISPLIPPLSSTPAISLTVPSELGNKRTPSPPSPLISPLIPPLSSTPAISLTVPSELGNKRTPSPPNPLISPLIPPLSSTPTFSPINPPPWQRSNTAPPSPILSSTSAQEPPAESSFLALLRIEPLVVGLIFAGGILCTIANVCILCTMTSFFRKACAFSTSSISGTKRGESRRRRTSRRSKGRGDNGKTRRFTVLHAVTDDADGEIGI